ncbi:MAG: UDP-N-acetylmuramoyl-tripeptide--D-alanyl-D-alanine ligase [Treponema sp.]|nr:UDP-N-acetylmuramoyl-tripeptide--D-alanyl-D-alanine ligase [Treponema sp.]
MNRPFLMDHRSAALALGAELFPEGAEGGFTSVAIDSRKVNPASLFIALRGLSSDGHRFLRDALEAGAAGAMVTREGLEEAGYNAESLSVLAAEKGAALFIVKDTLKGLQDLAAAYLDLFPRLLRIGITGSSGKTTTKEITASIFGKEKNVVMNSGNFNSETGLPLSAFNTLDCHEVGIFEAGMNRKGEIAELAAVLKPKIALITNIGPAHIGVLGSMENIAEEKKQIFSQFTGKETALIPEDDPFRDYLAQDVKGKVIFYGQNNLEASGKLNAVLDRGLAGTEINWEGIPVSFGLPGKHNVKNALAAAALANEAGISASSIRNGLAGVKGIFGRSEVLQGKTTVIRDCYNSNPDSAAEAIVFCDSIDWSGRRIYIIGSMLELGEHEEEEHRKIGQLLGESRADLIFLYGKETESSAKALNENRRKYFHTNSMDQLSKELEKEIRSGDLVLLKGSRGCALEKLSDIVYLEGSDVS